ncbi:hypothetical protein CNMCM5793_002732 [Aspergillus hiratsukae]|uniref:Uncharacterized protein n=1 Tax=Aspergillus hiratsukae TaxID=1194566 RepID=A0A8H6PD10_9EURO|nr:hypothetical protein CNMCM5793_002732 [Aspergillus hiratsukae]KAF7168011.1 hypothetical protein CNMCM6106_003333 [Aspergillus hiratsukae]
MHFTTLLLTIFPAALMASPLEARSGIEINLYSGDMCDGQVDTVTLAGSGAYRCVAVTNKRSIQKPTMNNCAVRTWSGSNCEGSSWELANDNYVCHSILYASVSIQCE